MSNETTLADLKKMKADYETKMKEQGEILLKRAFAEFFAANPGVEAVRWAQYTPYFNDGDSCTFGVQDPMVSLKDVPADVEFGEDGFSDGPVEYGGYGKPDVKLRDATDAEKETGRRLKAAATALKKMWNEVQDDDLFLMTFGDHQQVTATAAGFDVDEYEHD